MQDLRLAIRSLRATPIVTLLAILSLALGAGANTALYSIVNSLLYRPLPVDEPERLVRISDAATPGQQGFLHAVFGAIKEQSIFDAVSAWSPARFTHAEGIQAELVSGAWVSGSYLEMLGVRARPGRILSEADDRPGGGVSGPVMVISDALWRRRFDGDPSVIGRRTSLDGIAVTIVGVTPRTFFGTDVGSAFDVFVPIADEPTLRGDDSATKAGGFGVQILARLKSGQTPAAAAAALRAVQSQIRESTMPPAASRERDPYAKDYLTDPFTVISAPSGTSILRRRYAPVLTALLAAAGVVLFIACANAANLLLARAAARKHELSVRVALGASRWRLVRQLLIESVVLTLLAVAAGVVCASWAARFLVGQLSTRLAPIFLDLSIDWRLLTFASGLAAAVMIVVGVMPAIRAAAVAPLDALKEHGRGAEYRGRIGFPDILVVAQVGFSVVLVVAAGLFVRTLSSLATRDLGFAVNRILLATVDSRKAVVDPSQRLAMYERVRQAVSAAAGVEHVAVSSMTPVSNLVFDPPIDVSGGRELPLASRRVYSNTISADWFRTYQIPLIAGRQLTEGDRLGTEPVAVVNQAFAQRFLAGANPIDHFITLPHLMVQPKPNVPIRIVGVVADVVYVSLRETPQATMYLPIAQHDEPGFIRALGTVHLNVAAIAGPPAGLAKAVAASIERVHPGLSVTFRPLQDQIDDSLARERVMALLASFFGGVALLLAALGLYGVTAYAVARRRIEIGIRMALGAAPASVVRLMLSRVTVLVATGIVAGVGVSLWMSTFVASLLFGLAPRDPVTMTGGVTLLAVIGCFAGWLPAYRASRIDPAEVLRDS